MKWTSKALSGRRGQGFDVITRLERGFDGALTNTGTWYESEEEFDGGFEYRRLVSRAQGLQATGSDVSRSDGSKHLSRGIIKKLGKDKT